MISLLSDLQCHYDQFKAGPLLVIPGGFPGHAMYLNIVWYDEQFYLRWDNQLKDTEAEHGMLKNCNDVFGLTLSTLKKEKLDQVPIQQFFQKIFQIRIETLTVKEGAIDEQMITSYLYDLYDKKTTLPRPCPPDIPGPAFPMQKADTCVLENYWVGMRYRTGDSGIKNNQSFADWLRTKFLKASTSHQVNLHHDLCDS